MRRRGVLPVAAALAGACVALAGLVAYSRREVRRAEEAYGVRGRLVELPDGAVVHVVEEGPSDAPPLVVVHGADGVGLAFTETVTAGLAAGHRVVTIDRPGHGWSSLAPGTRADIATNAEALRGAVRALGIERPVVIGHSYGGLTALAWALEHPGEVRALVLLAPVAAFPWRGPLALLRIPALPLVGRVLTDALVVPLGRLVIGPLSRNAFAPQPVPEAYDAMSRAVYLRPAQFRALASEYATLREDVRRLAPRFRELSLPVEIVAAQGDRVTRPEAHARPLAWMVPDARLVELPGLGHEFYWTRPDAVADAVRRAEERSR